MGKSTTNPILNSHDGNNEVYCRVMLYKLAHILRDKFGWLWNIIEWMNGVAFSVRYGKRLNRFAFTTVPEGYDLVPIKDVQTEKLVGILEAMASERKR